MWLASLPIPGKTGGMNSPHVVVNYGEQPPVFECRHCGATEEIRLPVAVDMFNAMGDVFVGRHKDCQGPDE
jgi:hypothetical protein